MKQFLRTLTLTVAMALAGTAGFSGVSYAQQALGELEGEFGDWQQRCDQPPGSNVKQCALIQSVTDSERDTVGLTAIILKTADQQTTLMRILVPLGVLLPSQLGLKIDGKDVGRMPFIRCLPLPSGCVSEAMLEKDLIDKLSAGQTATFIIFETPEEGIGIPISLGGLKEGLAALP
ncbi:invasion associated locus B family protein [Pseudovibrio sp. Tun.PSC04-5.I4]|uniref:invasion associated locus B family protein n=1 Tax=Pseudovibrio sp. Tun.PSC04-5.I4 TaxID=1798213 RepID=UPI00088DC9AB|nr:invasion associated locus B family protein [Pseudovibrio sp. Tun.PSC04-5.I4]SDQ79740.1 Invasion protein IalB, involved in pathogenesis [Pseudovibrio sp. Tun.PSC04-5.I4]